MKSRLYAALLLGAAALGSGCARTEGVEELAGELRALRLQLRSSGPAAPAATDAKAMAQALAPLREVLDGLAASQRELQGKQLALTQELQRWSQLLVESTNGAHADQGKALGARLQQLETALQEQGERHRQVEGLLQGALDRTADRLESFLRQIETLTPPPRPVGLDREPQPTPAPAAGNAGTAAPNRGEGSSPNPPTAPTAIPREAGLSAWLWTTLTLSATAVSFVCWRAAQVGGRRPKLAVAAESPIAEPATQDLWEAAALLGEVVGRLRATAMPGQAVVVAEPAVGPEPVTSGEIEDLFVLEDDGEPIPARGPVAEPKIAAMPVATLPSTAPLSVTCQLQPRDLPSAVGAVRRLLGEDPRVLRRPEPVLTPNGATLLVCFALLPGLPPGERSQLEQRLRDAGA